MVGEPHGAELTGEGGSRRSREAEQSAARSVQLHACTGTSLHTCTQVRVYSVHSPLMRFFLLFSLFILKYECLFLNQSLSACSESVLLSEKSTQAHSASVICFTLFSIQENELQLRLWWFTLWLKPCGGQKCLTLLHPPPLAPIFSSLSLFQESKRYQSPCLHLHVTYPQKQSEESG